ncbi:MAG: ParB/RepB/Spo0J family partition protein [Geminicoccaceae bacterium]
MTTTGKRSRTKTITLAASKDIPFDRLVLSQSNVRQVKAGVTIEDLAKDIERRGLLQGLLVRAVVDDDKKPTGMFEIPAGGRRYRALELLVSRKRLKPDTLVPCILREGGLAEEDSLAENVQRVPLHPLDQFRTFLTLREKGQSEEEIAATFFVSVQVVRQRLKLASVSPRLLDAYADDEIGLDQLMAFAVCDDHQRQEQVFEELGSPHERQPWAIRRRLTEQAVRASDKRARLVGLDAYIEAGGTILRDLFEADDGGWLQDAALLDRLVTGRLRQAGEALCAEGWKWVDSFVSRPFDATYGLRRLQGEEIPLTAEEEAGRERLRAEQAELEAAHADADELPDDVDARLGEIEELLEAIERRPLRFEAEDIARAGAFVSVDGDGKLRIERGFVRPEDEPVADVEIEAGENENEQDTSSGIAACDKTDPDPVSSGDETDEENNQQRSLTDRLMAELTAHRTVALRHVLGEQPNMAFLAALHAVTLRCFYHHAQDSCLELDLRCTGLDAQAPDLGDSRPARAIGERHDAWIRTLPNRPEDLWDALMAFDDDSRQALFAHCIAGSIHAVVERHNRRPRAMAHADRLATAVGLDMNEAGWKPTAANFLARVTKAQILEAVREARGEDAARAIEHLKKDKMAEQAEELLDGTGWLPEPLRRPGIADADLNTDIEPEALAAE